MMALTAILGLIRRYPLHLALIIALAACGWQSWRVSRVKHALTAERAAHAETVTRYTEAQRQAAITARAARVALEARYRAQAEKADHEHAISLHAALRGARAYADANRVRAEAVEGLPGTTGATGKDRSAEGGNRSGAQADLVAVTTDDLEICTVNTARLEAVRQWALTLNDR